MIGINLCQHSTNGWFHSGLAGKLTPRNGLHPARVLRSMNIHGTTSDHKELCENIYLKSGKKKSDSVAFVITVTSSVH